MRNFEATAREIYRLIAADLAGGQPPRPTAALMQHLQARGFRLAQTLWVEGVRDASISEINPQLLNPQVRADVARIFQFVSADLGAGLSTARWSTTMGFDQSRKPWVQGVRQMAQF
jgi:hypothetical protein